MTPDALTSAIRARPFESFVILLPDGGSIPVRHPEYIAYKGGRIALVFSEGEGEQYESIDIALITRLSVSPVADPPTPPKPAQAF